MKRRTFLASAVPLAGLGQWLQRLFLVNQGEVVEKRITVSDGAGRHEIARIDATGQSVSPRHEAEFGESIGKVDTKTAQRLRDEYGEVTFRISVAHHETSFGRPAGATPVDYQTTRVLYSGVAVGDHISFQTSILRENAVISLSCLTDDEESLQRRCGVAIEDPSEER